MADRETYRRVLRERGLQVTESRLAMMATLHRADSAISPSRLLQMVRKDRPMHKTTVYRNLGAFQEAGLVRKLPSDGRPCVYELTCPHSLPVHPHFSCRSCGEVICLEPVDLASLWGPMARKRGLLLERTQITLSGLCSECRDRGEEGS